MKGILEFDLDDYSDKLSHKRATSSTDVYLSLHDIDDMLRGYTKYEKGILSGDKIALPEGEHVITETESLLLYKLAETIRLKVGEIIESRGINMDDLE